MNERRRKKKVFAFWYTVKTTRHVVGVDALNINTQRPYIIVECEEELEWNEREEFFGS